MPIKGPTLEPLEQCLQNQSRTKAMNVVSLEPTQNPIASIFQSVNHII